MIVYSGFRGPYGLNVYILEVLGDVSIHRGSLTTRTNLVNHSPFGFGWGNMSAGAAQLALALAAHATQDDTLALRVYQELKIRAVSKLDAAGWRLSSDELLSVIEQIEADQAVRSDDI